VTTEIHSLGQWTGGMMPYQQPYVWFVLLKKTAADGIHRLVEQDIWLIVSDLLG
jgi:hypothetical protein